MNETNDVVAAYYRISLARDGMKGPELYESEIERYCSYRKLQLARIYSDLDYSAFRGAKSRPALAELVEHRSDYAAVIVPKLSRFGRSVKELVRLFELFDADSIPLVFLDMNLDTSTSQGRLLRHILAAFAEYESDVKADYTRANHRRVRAEGRPWGIAPFGYVRGGRRSTWSIDDAKAEIVRGMYEDYAAGSSANAVAKKLNGAGITTARGHRWKGQAIGKILDNPAYAGLSLIDDELVPARWRAIVTRDTWDAVRARRAADPRRRGNLGKPRPRAAYLLSGLMYCGLCGRKMSHTTTTRDKRGVYHCGSNGETWCGCLDMRVHGDLAETYVGDRFVERCAFTILTESGARAGSPRRLWGETTLPERQRLLGLVIARIVVTPTGEEVPRPEYRTRLRHVLDIEWRSEVTDRPDIAVAADPPPLAQHRAVSESRHEMFRAAEYRAMQQGEDPPAVVPGTSWAQWRRERLLPR